MTADADMTWLVDASYTVGGVNLEFIRASDLERVSWTDTDFQPYYLALCDLEYQVVDRRHFPSRTKQLGFYRMRE